MSTNQFFNYDYEIKNNWDTHFKRACKLAQCNTGAGEDNFLNGIIVQFDLNAPIKMWTEAQRYHFLDFVSSQSTMHRISKFNLKSQYNKYVDSRIKLIMEDVVRQYNENPSSENYLKLLNSNPCGCCLTARMTTNYRQLKTILRQRENHRLPDWREYCEWIKSLPYSKEFILGKE